MSPITTITVRLQEPLSDFVAANGGGNGACDNVRECIRVLIRQHIERAEKETFDRLKAELVHAFAAPESSYKLLTAAQVIARNQRT